MKTAHLIDIIIPAHNAHAVVRKTLSSIACQTMADAINIILVDDNSDEGYEKIVDTFHELIHIELHVSKRQLGCGKARQLGLDYANSPYVMFVDADDMIYAPEVCQVLYNAISLSTFNVVYGKIRRFSSTEGIMSDMVANHMTWIFGSIYRRKFLLENNIRFFNNSCGEDVAFNQMCKLLSPEKDLGTLDNYITYLWTDLNKEHRISTPQFQLLDSKLGFIDNIKQVYDTLKSRVIVHYTPNELNLERLAILHAIYNQYNQLLEHRDELSQSEFNEYVDKYNEFVEEYLLPRIKMIPPKDYAHYQISDPNFYEYFVEML